MVINYIEIISTYHPNIYASCLGDTSVYSNIVFHGDVVTKETLDSQYLSLYKAKKNASIDVRTGELIEQGFTYNSTLFSSSETAQKNWLAMDQLKDSLSYPFPITTNDDNEYLLQDATEVRTFVLVAMGTIETHYASGRNLKVQVNNAISVAEVDAAVDNR